MSDVANFCAIQEISCTKLLKPFASVNHQHFLTPLSLIWGHPYIEFMVTIETTFGQAGTDIGWFLIGWILWKKKFKYSISHLTFTSFLYYKFWQQNVDHLNLTYQFCFGLFNWYNSISEPWAHQVLNNSFSSSSLFILSSCTWSMTSLL